jgi:hypothetical protein
MKKYKEYKDYRFFDYDTGDEEKLTGIELLIKEYEGVLYHYGQVQIVDEGEFSRLKFDFTILEAGNHNMKDLEQDENFVTIMGDILTIILMKKFEDESSGKNNPKEFGV